MTFLFKNTIVETIIYDPDSIVHELNPDPGHRAVGAITDGLDSDFPKELVSSHSLQKQCIEDPETGDSVVQNIHLKADVYEGEDLTVMPDLILEPKPGYSFTGGYSPDADLFHKVTPDEDFHLGKHYPEGMMILNGPGINTEETSAELLDLTPTLLYYLGIQPGRELDGTVRTEVFDTTIDEPKVTARVADDDLEYQFSDDEEQAVEERLEELGYR